MTKKNQFWRGMLLGALAGGAISLLDKQTREVMYENVQKTTRKVTYVLKNPGEVTEKVKEAAEKLKTTVKQVSEDISYITDKVEEFREITPQVTDILKETKDTFTKSDEELLLAEVVGEEEKIH
ncbi:YtxH domain-containing protein [Neobacillus sp. OS1-33]|uniref:YtxH domain-containing protein n=1 Tax=Neobacillus sp. OS1-33 TaxID=3070683 RepID=UPI0027DEAF9F|nr:YtxH domain-containing protein [Neobacillus sp. OS1-33]WML28086.1 YtxH domain-containing protein [Neobacillus sp. OS1-33]